MINSLVLVQEAQAIIKSLEDGIIGSLELAHTDEDGYIDYDGLALSVEQIEMSIGYIVESVENPTLPSIEKLVKVARAHGLEAPNYVGAAV